MEQTDKEDSKEQYIYAEQGSFAPEGLADQRPFGSQEARRSTTDWAPRSTQIHDRLDPKKHADPRPFGPQEARRSTTVWTPRSTQIHDRLDPKKHAAVLGKVRTTVYQHSKPSGHLPHLAATCVLALKTHLTPSEKKLTVSEKNLTGSQKKLTKHGKSFVKKMCRKSIHPV
jgi:hypothetical protein